MLAPAPVGGLETVVATLSAAQRQAGHRVIVAPTMSAREGAQGFVASLEASEVEVQPLIVSNRGYLREVALIRRVASANRVNVVHTHGYRSDIVGGHAGHGAGLPIVTTLHGFTGGGWKNRGYEALQRRVFRRFDAVVVVSRPQAEQLRASGVSSNRLHIVPNALTAHPSPLDRAAARSALGLPANGIIAGWVGRISPEKGIDVFIDAVALLEDRGVSAAVLGDGVDRSSGESRAANAAPGRFFWLGAVPDAPRYFAAFDLFVMSSRAEGLPMVLLEAMAAGIPIVSTNVGGIPDLLSPSEGLLVPPDDPKALAAAMRATIDDPRAATTRAQAAQRRQASDFSVGPWSERYERIYRDLIAARTHVST